ncbi:barnase inhibitor [Muricauda sp. JGD-17]|uniref:Barnase inhibitor n=1 Tax=Flagellimonas ochracea TaxID=2696472 RepID=A0A964TDV9_9FLAO|nr:barstar family protein [Allomuricauda ochracea]NAY92193.1 barnase inhibitor [Allomuricauda ochracea]
MTRYVINGKKIRDWKSFHFEFKFVMKFPDYYGENMDAWIDCMDELTEEPTLVYVENGKVMKETNSDLVESLLECTAFVDFRKLEAGSLGSEKLHFMSKPCTFFKNRET